MSSSPSLSSSKRSESRNAPVYQSVIRYSYDKGGKRQFVTGEELVGLKSVLVNVEELLFTQDTIGQTFKGRYQNNQIHDTLDKFLQGKMTVSDFPNLEVVCHEGHLWSLDNRRLWIFKKAKISQVPVNIVSFNHNPRFKQVMKGLALKQMLQQKDFLPKVRGNYGNTFNIQRSVSRPISDQRSSSTLTPEAGPKPFPKLRMPVLPRSDGSRLQRAESFSENSCCCNLCRFFCYGAGVLCFILWLYAIYTHRITHYYWLRRAGRISGMNSYV